MFKTKLRYFVLVPMVESLEILEFKLKTFFHWIHEAIFETQNVNIAKTTRFSVLKRIYTKKMVIHLFTAFTFCVSKIALCTQWKNVVNYSKTSMDSTIGIRMKSTSFVLNMPYWLFKNRILIEENV